MMGAILDNDIIVSLSGGPVTLGPIPRGVGLERLRYDGKGLVDLQGLNSFWVRYIPPASFELHAIEVSGSQAVTMSYADRGRLIWDAGTIRLLTDQEVNDRAVAYQRMLLKNSLRSSIKIELGDGEDRLADLHKLVYLLISHLFAKDEKASQELTAFFEEIQPAVFSVYPSDVAMEAVRSSVTCLAITMPEYYKKKDDLSAAVIKITG